MRTIRASEIGSYIFCHRAWWYRVSGVEPANRQALQYGTQVHSRHGLSVRVSRLLMLIAALSLAAGLALLVFQVITGG